MWASAGPVARSATERAMITRFCAAKGWTEESFSASYAVLGAQRALRIIGIFSRLCLKGGKEGYIELIPRVWEQLHRNLAHPALNSLAEICAETLPVPDAGVLERIRSQCGHHPHR